MSYLCQKHKKELGSPDFVSEIKRVENYLIKKKIVSHSAWSTAVYSEKYQR